MTKNKTIDITYCFNRVSEPEKASYAATIGFFDGVHKGHRYLIEQVCRIATEQRLHSLLITFPEHPRRIMQTDFQPKQLTTSQEKECLLADTEVEACAMIPFTHELATLSARDFMKEVLWEQLHVHTLIIGHDHRFGHNRSEGFEDYVRYGKELGMEVIRAEAYTIGETNISSSVIRQLLQEGKVEEASRCLGYPYFIEGEVIGGKRIGRTLGFPTANLQINNAYKLIPADGVYAVYAHIGNTCYKAMLNIGRRPTVERNGERTIEAHIFQFEGNLYNTSLRIEFVKRIRGEQKFADREALAAQLKMDAEEIEKMEKAVSE